MDTGDQHVGKESNRENRHRVGIADRRRDRSRGRGLLGKPVLAQPVNMSFQKTDTAVVFIDPQNDVLSAKGANWGAVGASVTENKTVENMERIFKAAKANGYEVFMSPPLLLSDRQGVGSSTDHSKRAVQDPYFRPEGTADPGGFRELGCGLTGSFQALHRRWKTIIVSPHKVGAADQRSGPATGQAADQPRSFSVGCWRTYASKSHLREFLERGFEVAVVRDATAGPRHPGWGDGYQAAMINYRFLAHAVLSTDEPARSHALSKAHSSPLHEYKSNALASSPATSKACDTLLRRSHSISIFQVDVNGSENGIQCRCSWRSKGISRRPFSTSNSSKNDIAAWKAAAQVCCGLPHKCGSHVTLNDHAYNADRRWRPATSYKALVADLIKRGVPPKIEDLVWCNRRKARQVGT